MFCYFCEIFPVFIIINQHFNHVRCATIAPLLLFTLSGSYISKLTLCHLVQADTQLLQTVWTVIPPIAILLPGTAALPELQQICQYLGDLRDHLTTLQKESELQGQWCHVGYVLDFLLFRIYLLLISCYALVIISMWCIWISQT